MTKILVPTMDTTHCTWSGRDTFTRDGFCDHCGELDGHRRKLTPAEVHAKFCGRTDGSHTEQCARAAGWDD